MTDMIRRSFPLEDIRIRSTGDGRTVEAYAAVFDTPVPISDRDGVYLEQIAPSAFKKAIHDAAPSGSRTGWLTKAIFNHGRDMYGHPAPEFTMPLGAVQDIQADGRGLLTVTKYARTRVADDVLELIREGAITAQSFQGRFIRSDVPTPRGGFVPDDAGDLTLVTRQEVSLTEFGPTPFPAYADAAVVGVRGSLARLLGDDELLARLEDFLATRGSAPVEGSDTPNPGAVDDKPGADAHLSGYLNLRAEARKRGII